MADVGILDGEARLTRADVRRGFEDLYGKTVPAFNDAMAAKGYVRIMTVREVEKPPAEKEEEEDEDADD